MIIAVQSQGNSENDMIDKRFGRCSYFAFYDDEKENYVFSENEFKDGGSAGIKAATMVAEMASVIIGINIGPNAFAALEKSNVKIFSGQDNKSISENIGLFKSNNLDIIENSNAEAHN